ncbi:hypothetical protein BV898_11259 [Hypsibius exemplaris]|uniref:Uncharacterized protein n=1 Tax=Hypsibius exemplaris TaxID=2072580 RepID=A0A1W0WH57_HYPEX|nr:hypothetical protein BV898_11259 [Hypsibius exemplaris]
MQRARRHLIPGTAHGTLAHPLICARTKCTQTNRTLPLRQIVPYHCDKSSPTTMTNRPTTFLLGDFSSQIILRTICTVKFVYYHNDKSSRHISAGRLFILSKPQNMLNPLQPRQLISLTDIRTFPVVKFSLVLGVVLLLIASSFAQNTAKETVIAVTESAGNGSADATTEAVTEAVTEASAVKGNSTVSRVTLETTKTVGNTSDGHHHHGQGHGSSAGHNGTGNGRPNHGHEGNDSKDGHNGTGNGRPHGHCHGHDGGPSVRPSRKRVVPTEAARTVTVKDTLTEADRRVTDETKPAESVRLTVSTTDIPTAPDTGTRAPFLVRATSAPAPALIPNFHSLYITTIA